MSSTCAVKGRNPDHIQPSIIGGKGYKDKKREENKAQNEKAVF
jgi:hypothetical protein